MPTWAYLVMGALTFVSFWIFLPKFRMPSWFAIYPRVPFTVIPLLWAMAFCDRVKPPVVNA